MSRARKPRSVATVLPASGGLARLGHVLADVGEHLLLGLLQRDAAGRARRAGPSEVCMSRTKSSICSSASAGGLDRRRRRRRRARLSSESVTRAATSIERVGRQVEPGHLAVDPDDPVGVGAFGFRSWATRDTVEAGAALRLRAMTWGEAWPPQVTRQRAAPTGRRQRHQPADDPALGGSSRWSLRRLRCCAASSSPAASARRRRPDLAARSGVAVLPLGIVVPTFLWLDRFEAEPAPLPAVRVPLGRAGRQRRRAGPQHRRLVVLLQQAATRTR